MTLPKRNKSNDVMTTHRIVSDLDPVCLDLNLTLLRHDTLTLTLTLTLLTCRRTSRKKIPKHGFGCRKDVQQVVLSCNVVLYFFAFCTVRLITVLVVYVGSVGFVKDVRARPLYFRRIDNTLPGYFYT